MISKAQIKYIQSLKIAKFRQKYNIFIAEGDKLVKEMLQGNSFKHQYLVVDSNWKDENNSFIKSYKDDLLIVTTKEMKLLSNLKTPPGILALFYKNDKKLSPSLIQNSYSIYLDQIKDPGNLGTIIRIADWYGFQNVICAPGSVDFYNPKVVQATMGSIARVQLLKSDYTELMANHGNTPVYAAVIDGEEEQNINYPKDGLILIIGNESKGISKELQSLADYNITISNKYNLGAESLNASVATAILCASIRR